MYDTRMNRKVKKVPTNSTTTNAHARIVLVVILSLSDDKEGFLRDVERPCGRRGRSLRSNQSYR